MINKSVDTNTFPCALKYAEVVPVYKKDDPLDKSNYRPVRVRCLAKLFESIVLDQINVFFESVSLCSAMSYFTNWKQMVKVGNCKREWVSTEKGALQGSVFGPYLSLSIQPFPEGFNLFVGKML